MAIAVSQTPAWAHNVGAATENFTFTTVSGDTLAVFFIFQDSATSNAITSVTWDSGGTNQACTLIKQQQMTTTGNGAISAYAVINPTVGTKTLAVVQALGQQMAAGMQTYTGNDTTSVANACTNPLAALGSSGTAQAGTQTGNSGDMLVSAYGTINTFSASNQTLINNIVANARESRANRAVATGSGIPLTATLTATAQWCAVSFTISQPVVAAPFNQLDWSKTSALPDGSSSSPVATSLNVALYTGIGAATQIRGGVYTPPFRMKGAQPDPAAYNSALYAVTVGAPFAQLNWPIPRALRPALAPDAAYNQSLYTVAVVAAQPRGALFMRPFPLPPVRPDATQSLNPNLFTNPVPFLNIGTAPAVRVRAAAPPDAPYNQALYTVVVTAAPFIPIDFSAPSRPRSAVPFDAPYNQSLYSVTVVTAPFIPVDFQQPRKPLAATPLDVQFNPNLFTNPIPILNVHYVQARALRSSTPPDAPYNQPLYSVTVAGTPFVPIDFGQVRKPAAAVPLDPGYNQSLYAIVVTGVPFIPVDFARPRPVASLQPAPQAYLQALYSVAVTFGPFVQVDGAKAAGMPRSSVNPYASANYTIRMPTGTVTPQLHARPFIGSNFGWKPF